MKSRILKRLIPAAGIGAGLLAVSTYFCGHAETAVCLLACAVFLIGTGILAFVGIVALSWLLTGVVRGIARLGAPHAVR